ncbi:type II secretion system F family protein [Inhella gelatinilytica]|uniref:Type II secretion system F family protein n=1 Tax=Inhella gelatinilytica TaxID=2795030 RepID=A0A931NDD3_9BURK|nr:type II secretion system F family protein [Inhella gelatinilytica]MBH9551331.1 type II secretion system F family protein [Inhella gelatinilytica]
MPNFAYTGRRGPEAVRGVLDAASAGAVADALRAEGITVLSVQADAAAGGDGTSSAQDWLNERLKPAIQPVDMLVFTRQLHTLLKSGVPILRALAGLTESATNLRMKDTLQAVRSSLESGIELSRCFAQQSGVFDQFFVAMVRVGEMTGRLDEIFLRLFEHLEFELFMRQQVKSALRYPMFVMIAMAAAIGVINVMVIPAFAGVFKSLGAELPLATRILLATSNFTVQYGWALLLLLGGAIFGLKRWVATEPGRLAWDRFKLKIPVAGKIVLKAELARFARSLALSLRSGLPVEQALTVVAQTCENTHIASKIEGMRAGIERGESLLRAAIASGVFTPVVLQMVAVGEETGSVDELMLEVAQLYGNDVQYELKTLSQQIEPILIVFLGVLVLILALGVFLPIWDLGRVSFKK